MLIVLLHTLALTGLLSLGFALLGLLSDHLAPALTRRPRPAATRRRSPTPTSPSWRRFAGYLQNQRHRDLGRRWGGQHDH